MGPTPFYRYYHDDNYEQSTNISYRDLGGVTRRERCARRREGGREGGTN